MKNNTLAIIKNRIKLEKMIVDNEDYEKILKQSQKLDEFINIEMRNQLTKDNTITDEDKLKFTK